LIKYVQNQKENSTIIYTVNQITEKTELHDAEEEDNFIRNEILNLYESLQEVFDPKLVKEVFESVLPVIAEEED